MKDLKEQIEIEKKEARKKRKKELQFIEERDQLVNGKTKEISEKKKIAEVQRLEDLKKYYQEIEEKIIKKQQLKEVLKTEQLKDVESKVIQIKEEMY